MTTAKLNVIWKAWGTQYIGCGDTLERVRVQGVVTFEGERCDILCDYERWDEDEQVSYGESAGHFKVLGAFWGDYEELKRGEQEFISPEELFRLAQRNRETMEEMEGEPQ